jgi:hypothetical protein
LVSKSTSNLSIINLVIFSIIFFSNIKRTLKKGYPVVQVNKTNLNDLIVTQKWFLLDESSRDEDYKWFVPFTYTTEKENDFNFEKKPIWLKPSDEQCNKLN